MRNLASFSTPFVFERPAFENAARYLNSETKPVSIDDVPVFSVGSTCSGEFDSVDRLCVPVIYSEVGVSRRRRERA